MDPKKLSASQRLDQDVQLEEIRLLYGGTPFSYTASFAIALIIYNVLLGHVVSQQSLNIWLFTILGVLFIRTIDSYRFSKRDTTQQLTSSWRIRFYIGTGIAGFSWGLR